MTRSYRVKVGLTGRPEAMRLGATVTGQATMRAPGGIELPATALTIADNKPAVWVVDPQNRPPRPAMRPVPSVHGTRYTKYKDRPRRLTGDT